SLHLPRPSPDHPVPSRTRSHSRAPRPHGPAMRKAEVTRSTNETQISVKLDLDGTARSTIATGVPFLDHMLEQVARHGSFDVEASAKGDLHIDGHHTVEDVGITLGQAFAK